MESSNEALRKRVETVLDMAASTVSSLHESFSSGDAMEDEESMMAKAKSAADKTLESVPEEEQSQDKAAENAEKTAEDDLQGGTQDNSQESTLGVDQKNAEGDESDDSEPEGTELEVHG